MVTSVRAADYDRYLTLLYAPAEKRGALAALYAFDAEIARIRDRIRDALPGEVRLQWWRDAIASGHATGHEVADALNRAIADNHLPKLAFENYFEARIFDLYNDPMPSRTDLEGYCGETAGAIIQIACVILDDKAAPSAAGAAGHAGCAQAIMGMLRALPLHRARGQCFLPADLLAAAGTNAAAFLAEIDSDGARRAEQAMLALAEHHFKAFRVSAGGLPASLSQAFLPLALTAIRLAAMRVAGNLLQAKDDLSPLRKHWAIFNRAIRGWT